jgi:uncharacterized membrane protein YgcG
MAAPPPQNPDAGGGGVAPLPALPALHLGVRAARHGGDAAADAAAATLLGALRSLRAALGALFARDAASDAEARAWLRDAAGRAPARPAARLDALRAALARAGGRSALGAALLRLVMARRPADTLALLRQRDASLYERFFASASGAGAARVSAVFGAFSPDGRHPRGASALAQYLLQRRGALWPHLVWRGAHPQAPVVVTAKPHYWCELDAPATLAALAARSGAFFDFWASDEVADGLSGGDVLSLDVPFFLEELTLELTRGSRRLKALLDGVLGAEAWAQLAQRLLPTLARDDDALLRLLRDLFPRQDAADALRRHAGSSAQQQQPGAALAAAPFAGVTWRRVEDACVAAAAARPGGHAPGGAAGGLAALLAERAACGSTRARAAADAVDVALAAAAACDAQHDGGCGAHAALLAACAREASREEGRLLLLLAAWLLRTRLARLPRSSACAAAAPSDACATEAVMRAAGVAHTRDDDAGAAAPGVHGGAYALVGKERRRRHDDDSSDDDEGGARRRKKHKKKRKKRRKEQRARRRGSDAGSSDSDSGDSSGGGGGGGEAPPWAAREPDADPAAHDDGAAVAGDDALTWRCALDDFALRRGEGATRELLADAAADAWLSAVEEAADAARR